MMETALILSVTFILIPLFYSFRFGILSPLSLFFIFLTLSVPCRAIYHLITDTENLQISVRGGIILEHNYFIENFDVSLGMALIEISLASGAVCLSYYCGMQFIAQKPVRTAMRYFESPLLTPTTRTCAFLFVILIFLIKITLYYWNFGSVSAGIHAYQLRNWPIFEGLRYINLLTDFLVITALILTCDYYVRLKHSNDHVSRFWWILPISATLLLLLLKNSRGEILTVLCMLMIIVFACNVRAKNADVNLLMKVVVFSMIMLFVIVFGRTLRHSVHYDFPIGASWEIISQRLITEISNPFAIIDQYMLSKVYVERVGFDYGQQFYNYVFHFVPRNIWPDKPVTVALQMRREFWGESLTGIPPSMFGEFYIAFGYVGLAVGAILIGCTLALLQHLYLASLVIPTYSPFYALVTAYWIFLGLRSGLEIAVVKLVVVIIILKSILMFLRTLNGIQPRRRAEIRETFIDNISKQS